MATNKKYLKDFGKRLKQIRTENGLSQEELANKVGLHQCQIGSYECGLTRPSDKLLKTFGKVLNIDDIWKFKYNNGEVEINKKEYGLDINIKHISNSDTSTMFDQSKYDVLNKQDKQIMNELLDELFANTKK